jgi:toxin FitB
VADVLVDTDVFIDHLRGARELKPGKHRLHYSVVTRAELLASTTATDAVTRLLAPFREIPVDRAVAERAGRIRRELQVRLPDALIARDGTGAPTRPGDPQPVGLRRHCRPPPPGAPVGPPHRHCCDASARTARAHQEMVTAITPVARSAICENWSGCISMTRPAP